MNALIIDDEQHCIDALTMDLRGHCPNVSVVGTYTSAKDAIVAIKKSKPQLLFLDVQMPMMNGFEMLEALPEIEFGIIFTTAFDQFAAKAFRISAIDYLLKPIDSTDLVAAVKKAEEKVSNATGLGNIEVLLHNMKQPVEQQKVAFPSSDGYEFVLISRVIYCLAEGAYTRIVFGDKKPLLISRSLGDVEEMLPSELFLRIHHSTLVNLSCITHYSRKDGGFVTMNTNETLAVSTARKEVLLQHLGLK